MPKTTCSVVEDGERCERSAISRGYCDKHYRRWKKHGDTAVMSPPGRVPRSPAERFWEKVNKDGPVPAHRPELGPCWLWTASLKREGYGQFNFDGRMISAHRFAYELLAGPVPEGLTLDHLCHNGSGCPGGITCPHRLCVNPEHLEAVTPKVNSLRGEGPCAIHARQTHCVHGHPFDEANTYRGSNGRRACRACGRRNAARYRRRALER